MSHNQLDQLKGRRFHMGSLGDLGGSAKFSVGAVVSVCFHLRIFSKFRSWPLWFVSSTKIGLLPPEHAML